MKRMSFGLAGVLTAAILALASAPTQTPGFDVVEKTIPELGAAMASRTVTSRRLVEAYLARIAAFDQQAPALNAMITLNPNAAAEAEALDRDRALRGAKGAMQGIPIIMLHSYHTA